MERLGGKKEYKTYANYKKELISIKIDTENSIAEIKKQEKQKIETLIPSKNIEIGWGNYKKYSNNNIDIAEFKKMLDENYNIVIMFCFEKSEFQ